ncbi:hypothetical protein NP493_662g00005 [Ridgeia piscesae]|uniref:Uncharacterized protein n=1 Tax=Ridgeia piscesae TaxID=27915 RepID=A0AAD9KRT1_RIDPI|nr:hypothetical protein NP493_662g00005 [Ridgeia piscesae]
MLWVVRPFRSFRSVTRVKLWVVRPFRWEAMQAGEISMRQLKLAMEVGDKPIVIRCHLYFGLSLMQRGQLRPSRNVIRHQYNLAKSLPVMDRQLLDICQGLWTKLRYMYERRKVQKTSKRLQKMEEKES